MRITSVVVLVLLLGPLTGCAVVDWFFGAGETTDANGLVSSDSGTSESPAHALASLLQSFGPAGGTAAAGLLLAGEAYRRKRKKLKG